MQRITVLAQKKIKDVFRKKLRKKIIINVCNKNYKEKEKKNNKENKEAANITVISLDHVRACFD